MVPIQIGINLVKGQFLAPWGVSISKKSWLCILRLLAEEFLITTSTLLGLVTVPVIFTRVDSFQKFVFGRLLKGANPRQQEDVRGHGLKALFLILLLCLTDAPELDHVTHLADLCKCPL